METRRFKIAYLIDSLSFGGAEKQLTLLARELPDPFEAMVISLSERIHPYGEILHNAGVEVVALRRRSNFDVGRLWRATDILRKTRVDVVHGFLDAANAYAFTSARILRRPVILSLRSEMLRVSGPRAAVLSWMLRHSDRVLVNSRAGADYLLKTVNVQKNNILHIPNWIDPNRAGGARPLPPPSSPKTIGFVGRFAKPKRLHLLVDTFRVVLKNLPDAQLILMGGGAEEQMLTRQVKDLGIVDNVEFIAPSTDVDKTLRRLHLFALTSAFEGLPNAAVEALSLGVPIVSSPVGDVRELIVDGQTGTFFNNDHPEDMAATLVHALSDPKLLANALSAGPKLVEEKFSLRRALKTLTSVYDLLLRK